jgi:Xaa-Pro aminopeptidase
MEKGHRETDDVFEIFSDARKRSFRNVDGAGRPLKSPVSAETIAAARNYRIARLRAEMLRQDCSALILYNPINIRYAFDYANMQIWTMHEMMRHALIFAEGPAIMFEFKGCEHLCALGANIDEIRPALGYIYMAFGDRAEARASEWAKEIADLWRQHGKGGRIAVDRIEPHGLAALEAQGLHPLDGQKIMEHARAIKCPAEIEMMRWTIRVAESGMARMYEVSEPGVTENEVWAELHHENIRSGGEWFEARLLSSGPRTNPWMQEASDRIIRRGEMISFDTDMVGPYGYCADLSRSWTCGHTRMTNQQRSIYAKSLDQIEHNTALLRPGLSFRDFNERSWRIPEKHQPYRYGLALHGVGLVDEWPVVALHTDFGGPYGQEDEVFRPGMTVCVESLMAEEGSESVKLETQVLITESGHERLDSFPWETQ